MNFFDSVCQEPPTSLNIFGICDDQDGSIAYTDTQNRSKWIATVKNDKLKILIFTAIDGCIIKGNEEEGRGRCDAMITSDEHIFFIELKNEGKDWKVDAIEQLESSIIFFIDNHDVTTYKHKKAFACNKRRPHFQEIDNEFNIRFFRKYGFRIDAQAEIIVI